VRRELWIGLAHVRSDDDRAALGDQLGAFAKVVAHASSHEEFRDVVEQAAVERDLLLLELDDAYPLHRWLKRRPADDRALHLAQESLAAKAPVFDELHTYPPPEAQEVGEGELDYAAAREALERAEALRDVVRIRIASDPDATYDGFVVGVGKELVLLHEIDQGAFMNGYRAFRINDVREAESLDPDESFLARASHVLALEPVARPNVELDSVPQLIVSAQRDYPLIALHVDWTDPGVCYIGRARTVDDGVVELHNLSPAARWEETDTYRLEDVTHISFGDAYMHALAVVADDETES
jgi:hypothetical protein